MAGMPTAAFAMRPTIWWTSWRTICLLEVGRKVSSLVVLCPRGRLPGRAGRDGQWHGGWCGDLADWMQHLVAVYGLLVVLALDASGFGGAQCVDAEQVGQGAVAHGQGLGDLEEPDQLEAVQSLGARDSSEWIFGGRVHGGFGC